MSQKQPFIRKAKTADLLMLQKLATELMESLQKLDPGIVVNWYNTNEGEKYFIEKINGTQELCIVAEIDDEVVGYLTGIISPLQTWRPFKRAELENIYINEKYRGNSIGTLLFNTFVTWSKENGVEKIFLHTNAQRKGARKFYAKQGMVEERIELEKTIK
jgi:ribosomal protein S18 acetylase RimI-like enzyme